MKPDYKNWEDDEYEDGGWEIGSLLKNIFNKKLKIMCIFEENKFDLFEFYVKLDEDHTYRSNAIGCYDCWCDPKDELLMRICEYSLLYNEININDNLDVYYLYNNMKFAVIDKLLSENKIDIDIILNLLLKTFENINNNEKLLL